MLKFEWKIKFLPNFFLMKKVGIIFQQCVVVSYNRFIQELFALLLLHISSKEKFFIEGFKIVYRKFQMKLIVKYFRKHELLISFLKKNYYLSLLDTDLILRSHFHEYLCLNPTSIYKLIHWLQANTLTPDFAKYHL